MAETRANRLKKVLVKVLPAIADRIETGEWGKEGAPYAVRTLGDGRLQLVIENAETGERIGVVGTTREELLDKLEARVS